jgi:hypothetical protein
MLNVSTIAIAQFNLILIGTAALFLAVGVCCAKVRRFCSNPKKVAVVEVVAPEETDFDQFLLDTTPQALTPFDNAFATPDTLTLAKESVKTAKIQFVQTFAFRMKNVPCP